MTCQNFNQDILSGISSNIQLNFSSYFSDFLLLWKRSNISEKQHIRWTVMIGLLYVFAKFGTVRSTQICKEGRTTLPLSKNRLKLVELSIT